VHRPTDSPEPAGAPRPARLDVDRRAGLTLTWEDGTTAFYPVVHLRRHSPSADAKAIREEMARNPLTVLPNARSSAPLTIEDAELVGNYAVRLRFSDGHSTGIYSWTYLRSIAPADAAAPDGPRP
jgi:DUF971 family protein